MPRQTSTGLWAVHQRTPSFLHPPRDVRQASGTPLVVSMITLYLYMIVYV